MSKPTSIADYLEEAAQRAQKRGEHESAVDMLRAVLMMRSQVSPMPVDEVTALSAREYSPRVRDMSMGAEHREAISKGRSRRNALMKAAREANITRLPVLRDRLEEHGYKVSTAFLSMVGNKTRVAPPELLKALKKLGVKYEP